MVDDLARAAGGGEAAGRQCQIEYLSSLGTILSVTARVL
jgi:hypothetical protein